MVFYKSLTRELTFNAIGIFIILLAILVSTQAINLLGRAAEGQIANGAVAALIGFWALGLFPVPLILTVFISAMVVLTRLWRDHEMQVWLAAGLSQKSLLKPVLLFAIPLSILVGIVTLGIAPWADQRSQIYADQIKQKEDMSSVIPGVFKESSDGNRVYFVENYDAASGSARNIFFQDTSNGKITSIFARTGHLNTNAKGLRFLQLDQGYRYVNTPGLADYDVIAFQRHTEALDITNPVLDAPRSRQSQPTSFLLANLQDPNAKAELAWRLSLPFSCLFLAMLAIPLSFVNPRSGGYAFNLIAALLVYFIYQNALTFARNGIAQGSVPGSSIILVHLVAFILAGLGLYYRDRPMQTFSQFIQSFGTKKT